MSTKHGRHGRRVRDPLQNVAADPNPDVDVQSVFKRLTLL